MADAPPVPHTAARQLRSLTGFPDPTRWVRLARRGTIADAPAPSSGRRSPGRGPGRGSLAGAIASRKESIHPDRGARESGANPGLTRSGEDGDRDHEATGAAGPLVRRPGKAVAIDLVRVRRPVDAAPDGSVPALPAIAAARNGRRRGGRTRWQATPVSARERTRPSTGDRRCWNGCRRWRRPGSAACRSPSPARRSATRPAPTSCRSARSCRSSTGTWSASGSGAGGPAAPPAAGARSATASGPSPGTPPWTRSRVRAGGRRGIGW
ncbi:hypothetical protein PAI11_19070 [Patulibacter medicamentivorans]|uniref:Uncharacterized protein n=1 Tax=Patulibacter medicamentivorans TaxID=1097667 RepID=H0E522_9ACTN|nr:hypothetical protein PAI11_19070 [Patulibacter medicamentivorans]